MTEIQSNDKAYSLGIASHSFESSAADSREPGNLVALAAESVVKGTPMPSGLFWYGVKSKSFEA